MQIRIIKPGILSTVQDLGRRLYLSQAVPVSGVMDTLSARIANKAVGNDDNASVIEFTYASAEFVAETDIVVAYAGDGSILKAGEISIPSERPVFIPKGTIIKLANNTLGCRTYLSITGGWDVPILMNSRSTYITAGFGGLHGRQLQPGDVLCSLADITQVSIKIIDSLKADHIKYAEWSFRRQAFLNNERQAVRVIPGHEFTWFDSRSIINFLSANYTLTAQSNRMGYQLDGPVINRRVHDELLSTAVAPGTIQVTGSGKPVILMADCQTTGGYPRIAQVAAVDLSLCGQLKPGDNIYFKEISRHEAEMLYLEREQQLQKLTNAIKSKYL